MPRPSPCAGGWRGGVGPGLRRCDGRRHRRTRDARAPGGGPVASQGGETAADLDPRRAAGPDAARHRCAAGLGMDDGAPDTGLTVEPENSHSNHGTHRIHGKDKRFRGNALHRPSLTGRNRGFPRGGRGRRSRRGGSRAVWGRRSPGRRRLRIPSGFPERTSPFQFRAGA